MRVLKQSLFGTTTMTPIERREGRFLRAPDHPSDDGFAVGEGFKGEAAPAAGDDDKKPAAGAEDDDKKPAAGAEDDEGAGGDDEGAGDDEGDDEGEGEEDDKKNKKRKAPSDRIRELSRRLRDSERNRDEDRRLFLEKLDNLEKGLRPASGDDTKSTEAKAPDPHDQEKYPLGILDDRYIEDKIEWVASKKAANAVDAVLQRQQKTTQQVEQEAQLTKLRETADDLASKGSELFDDYEETVVQAGLRGEYKLTQATFEAAADCEHGAEILHELASDKKKAADVANLPLHQQVKFVLDRNAALSGQRQPRTRPGAGEPPQNLPRGRDGKSSIRPDTDNLDDFEKLYASQNKRR